MANFFHRLSLISSDDLMGRKHSTNSPIVHQPTTTACGTSTMANELGTRYEEVDNRAAGNSSRSARPSLPSCTPRLHRTMSTSTKQRRSTNCKDDTYVSTRRDDGKLRLIQPALYLSNSQIQSIQSTWRHVKEHHGERAIESILQKLKHDQPKMKEVFYHAALLNVYTRSDNSITTFRDHTRLVYRQFDQVVESLDNRRACDRVLREFGDSGSKHAFLRRSGFTPETWEKFGEAAVDVITGFDCVKGSNEAAKAWTILVASLIDMLRIGFENESRRRSYSAEARKAACE